MEFKIGDIIRDVEDGDCYYVGEVTEVENNEVAKYKVLDVFWCGDYIKEDEYIGKIIEPQWWYITK